LLAVVALGVALGCNSPTAPDRRTGYIALRILCDGSGAAPLACRAETYCSGLYRCPDPAADGRDVTSSAVWASADTTIARLAGVGLFEAGRPGDTVIRASVPELSSEAERTVAVFEGTGLLPTNEIFGSVYETGKTVATGAITGATVEVLNGHVAGRSVTSGVPPQLLPGFHGPFGGPGYYRVLGVPPGSYRLRVTAPGYISQERAVLVPAHGSPAADCQLVRR